MSPIDDELRSALSSRTSAVTPSPDLFAGVERRATRMRRQRVVAAVAGSALAVSVLGLGGPLVASSLTSTAPNPLDSATTQPAPDPAERYALDPTDPWPYRGLPVPELGEGFVETAQREWQIRHPGSELRPLFGQVHEPSQATELVFVAVADEDGPDSRFRWGVVSSSEAGPTFLHDDFFTPSDRFGLAVALPGDEVARLLVVASPGTTVEYAQPAQPLASITALGDGVGVTPLEGDIDGDSYGIRAPDGSLLTQLGAPDPATGPRPDNLLAWGVRGVSNFELEQRAAAGYARSKDVAVQDVDYEVLLTGGTDSGLEYTVLQAWTGDAPAQVFGWIESPGEDPEPQLRPATEPGIAAVAILLTEIPGRTTSELVLVPAPGTSQVLYTPRPGARERAVAPAPGLGGVVLLDREPADEGLDRLRLLDGDGNRDAPTFDGAVADLLCGESSCS